MTRVFVAPLVEPGSIGLDRDAVGMPDRPRPPRRGDRCSITG